VGHTHTHAADRRSLAAVLALTAVVLVAEVSVGLLSHSLALLADAGHVAVDASGLLLALVGLTMAARPASSARTFGLARVEVLGTAAGAALLGGLAVIVAVEAVRRLAHPQAVDGGPMLAVGLLGLVANAAALTALHGAQGRLAIRGARLEVASDLVGAVAVVIAASVVLATGARRADPVASLAVSALVIPRAAALLRETLDVLLESTPRGLDLHQVRRHLVETEGVLDVHDLHAWTITSGSPVLSAHVVVTDAVLDRGEAPRLLDRLAACMAEHFALDHVTLQLEPTTHAEHEAELHA
jgi:cobalt-zinc-cadmium efflux system protein